MVRQAYTDNVRCASVVRPLVSFCVCNFNYGRFLRPLLEAVEAQTYPFVEAVVVDDGSTDESRAILEEPRERVVAELRDHLGQTDTCNRSFELSRGDIVVFLDSDDLPHPDAAERIAAAFEDERVVMAMNRMDVIDADGRLVPGERRPPARARLSSGDLSSTVLERCAFNWPETSGQAYRRSFLDKAMPIRMMVAPDFYLSHLGALSGRIAVIEEPVVSYRVHGANKSIAPKVRGIAWLEERIQQRTRLQDEIREYGLEVGTFADAAAAAAWHPRDFILESLLVARARIEHEPGRLRHGLAGVRAIAGHPDFRLRSQLRHAGWFVAAAVAPNPTAGRLVANRFPQTALPEDPVAAGPT